MPGNCVTTNCTSVREASKTKGTHMSEKSCVADLNYQVIRQMVKIKRIISNMYIVILIHASDSASSCNRFRWEYWLFSFSLSCLNEQFYSLFKTWQHRQQICSLSWNHVFWCWGNSLLCTTLVQCRSCSATITSTRWSQFSEVIWLDLYEVYSNDGCTAKLY